jgi:hypothetical protein
MVRTNGTVVPTVQVVLADGTVRNNTPCTVVYRCFRTLDVTDDSKILCRRLLQSEQTVPQDSLFRDDLFEKTYRNIKDRNEAMAIRDIGLIIIPSGQTLVIYGAAHPNHL